MYAVTRLDPRADDGVSLVEVLITIVIAGLLFAGLLGGLASMVSTSALHRRQADVGAVTRSASEAVKAAAYQPCLTANYSTELGAVARPNDVATPTQLAVTKIDGTSCSGADPGLQMVQLQATSKDGKTTETLWVVKGNR